MGHGFDLKHAGHDRVPREVALEKGLVDGDIFDPGALVVSFEVDDAVDHEEGVAVRKDLHQLVDVEDGFAAWNLDGWNHGAHPGVFALEDGGHLGVWVVARFDADDVAHDAFTAEHEVADDVERLVAGEFIVEAHRFFTENLFSSDDHGVFQAASFDQAFVEQRFDIFVINEGSGWSDFLFVELGGDFAGEKLGEAAVGADIGDRNPELFIGDDGDKGAIFGFHVDGLPDFVNFSWFVLGLDAGFFDELDVGTGGTVADGRLVGVHFNDGVVNAHTAECREDMLDGVHFDRAFCQSGRPFDGLHLVHVCLDKWLVG